MINYKATIKLAKLSKSAGISRFVYASSQSMYGISDISNELDEYQIEKSCDWVCKKKWYLKMS